MRLIKAQSTNLRSIAGNGMKYDINSINRMGGAIGMVVPLGTTAERPALPEAGMMRYNTDVNAFEIYADGAWGEVRKKEPGNIVQQNLGNGDASETVFGPLDNGDANFPIPGAAQNLLVLVENVFQLSTTNYTLEQSASGNLAGPNSPYADGYYIKFTSAPDLAKPITVLHNFDK